MPSVAVDTHAIVWNLGRDPRLSTDAPKRYRKQQFRGDTIYVPFVCLVELTYLLRVPCRAH